MKTKYFIISGLLVVVGFSIFYATKKLIPFFYFENIDNLKKEGVFSFEGKKYTFDASKNGIIEGKNYTLVYGPKNNLYSFDIFKNGNYYKNLDTIFTV